MTTRTFASLPRLRAWWLAIAAVFSVGALAQPEPVLIGASLPVTGKDATYGRDLLEGARACLAATAPALEGDFDLGGMRFQFAPGKHSGGRLVEMTVINQSWRVAR